MYIPRVPAWASAVSPSTSGLGAGATEKWLTMITSTPGASLASSEASCRGMA